MLLGGLLALGDFLIAICEYLSLIASNILTNFTIINARI